MPKSKSTLVLLISLILQSAAIFAQGNRQQGRQGSGNGNQAYGVISGVVHDESTALHVEYANVLLLNAKDSLMVTGTITDNKGRFTFSSINPGAYIIKIQFIGYENLLIPDVKVSPQSANILLGDISLRPIASNLQGVEITSEKSVISNNLDKKIITVDKNMALGGGTATDVMENVPSVEVDAEGNISLRGNSNITLLIDGKPSSQAGIAASDMLNQIPASAIESVEVITNPSVRYDPDGTSGIINIVLKKKTLQGFNGMASFNVGTGDKYNGTLVLNYRAEKFNAFINYDTRIHQMNRTSQSIRRSVYGESVNILNQSDEGNMHRIMSRIGGGFDYYINTRNNITLNFGKRNMNFGGEGTLFTRSFSNDTLDRIFDRMNESDREIESYEYSLSYKHTFPQKGREFTNDLIINDNQMNSDSYIIQKDYDLNTLIPSSNNRQWIVSDNNNKMFTLQGNYIYPMINGSRIETGYKASVHDMGMDYDYKNFNPTTEDWISNEELRNRYEYTEQIYAVYGIYANSWKKFKYQAGLRFEQAYTDSKVGYPDDSTLKTTYSSFYPSFHTQYEVAKNKEIQLSYSRRVRRPSPRDMNPYVDYADSLNLRTGNPELKPEFTNSIELGLLQYFKQNSLTTTLFYRFTDNEVEDITTLLDPERPDGVTITKPFNISKETNYGLELVGNINPAKWLRTNANLSFFRQLMTEIPEYGIEGSDRFTWTARLNLTLIPWKTGAFQLIGNYHSPSRSVQEYDKERYFADLSFRQDFFKNKLSLSLRLTDIFNTRKFDDITYGNNFTIETNRTHESRVFYIGLQYQINNFKKKGREEGGGSEEMEIDEF